VCNNLKGKFETLENAENHYHLSLSDYLKELEIKTTKKQVTSTDKSTQTIFPERSQPVHNDADLSNIP